jgi:hypothetical protein
LKKGLEKLIVGLKDELISPRPIGKAQEERKI